MGARIMSGIVDDVEHAGRLADVMRALGHPARLRIMACLCSGGERTVGAISEAVGLPQAVTSQHLAALRLNGIVRVRRDGGFRHYAAVYPGVADMLTCLSRCCRSHDRRIGVRSKTR